jgi:hypothetical protein
VLAWSAYLKGNGALANVALEIVFATDPEYSLALLVDQALQNGLPPEMLRRSTEEAAREMAESSEPEGQSARKADRRSQVTRRTEPDARPSSG